MKITKVILKIRTSESRECQESEEIIQTKVCDTKIFQIIKQNRNNAYRIKTNCLRQSPIGIQLIKSK